METVTCANCGQVHMVSVSVAKTVWNGQKEVTYHYCGQNCLQEDYLKKLVVQLYE
jgi:transcription elongation factor Elf1